ncbi:hypothetical protein JOF28_000440 [Leucobacter exalbidus]|uniref:Uncharacterized protein n=1 Tax=Leucobacter exalbidus TaxID=662960 RepID=A0A940PLD6_9MICO|nr:hypothetical protein [Leucobacter exalbidus]MBP1325208.1 hypothetical protein [Leucobacter exalbidus]
MVEDAYGHAIGDVFFAVSPLALVTLIAIIFLPNIPLSSKSNAERLAEQSKKLPAESAGATLVEVSTGAIPMIDVDAAERAAAERDRGENPPTGRDSR